MNIKKKNFEHVLYLLESEEKKNFFLKMDSSKKTTAKLSRKVDLRGVYMEEYLWRLILSLIHTCYTSSIFSCILKEDFQKSTAGPFISFHILVELTIH